MSSSNNINLERFKKNPQGLADLVLLIEQAGPTQQKRLIGQILDVDSEFLFQALRRVIFFEELVYLDEGVLAELLVQVNAKILAYALYGLPKEFREKLLKLMAMKEQRAVADEEEKLGEGTVAGSYVLGAQRQVLKVARHLEITMGLSLDLNDCPRLRTKNLTPNW